MQSPVVKRKKNKDNKLVERVNEPISCVDVAGIFGGAVWKQSSDSRLLPFDTSLHPVLPVPGTPVMEVARTIAKQGGGGTSVGLPVQHLLRKRISVDVIVGITDNEDWAYGRGFECNSDFVTTFRRYCAEVNPKALAFLVTINPGDAAVAPQGEQNVHFIYGWSESVVSYILQTVQEGKTQMDEVRAIAVG
jgi:60 kDa SS-A/Ro ribonucleoprotein